MKTPPFLLFAALFFWGWQSNWLVTGLLTGALLEGSRIIKWRWELEDVDFNRIWSFCILVIVALGGYFFSTNDQGSGLSGLSQGAEGIRAVSASSTVATTSVLRWLPLVFFPFIAAQIFNLRPTVPVTAVSLVLRIRRRRGEQTLAGHYLDISYPYFMICVFSAGIHPVEFARLSTLNYFWGQAVLILWALWARRSGRFGLKAWAGGLAVVIGLGFIGQVGVNRLQGMVQDIDQQLFLRLFRAKTDPTRSVTAMGQIGELKLSPRIVIRLEPQQVGQMPAYLREASYRTYSPFNQTWFVGGGKNDYEDFSHESQNETAWTLVTGKTNTTAINIACYLNGRTLDADHNHEGLLPLPSGCSRLANLPAFWLRMNKAGAVLVSGPGLMIFNAFYGPGATYDSPPDTSTNSIDTLVPPNEMPALNQVIGEMNLTNASDGEKRLAVEEFFASKFTYSTWQGLDKRATTNATPLTRFLLTSRSGHCEYFATATVLLLRELGIPARYAVGYSVHEASGSGYVVRERDAHAWCLIWNRQTRAWEDFDTTPASWVAIEGSNASVLDILSDARAWLVFQIEKVFWRQANLRQYVLWTLAPVMAVLLYYIIFQRRAKARAAGKKAAPEAPVIWPGHDSAFYQLEKPLAARGLPRQPQEPLSEWLERALAEPALAGLREQIRELLLLHYRYRFDPHGLSDSEKNALLQNVNAVLTILDAMKSGNGQPS